MRTQVRTQRSNVRPVLMAAAGLAILLLSMGAALVRSGDGWSGSAIVAWLMIAAGLIEMAAGALRNKTYLPAMLAGGVTLLSGLAFTIDPASYFAPAAYVLLGWLCLRSAILLSVGLCDHGSARTFAWLAAATDLALGLFVLVSLTALTVSISLFGPSPVAINGFAGILALSFVVTGIYILEVAASEAGAAD